MFGRQHHEHRELAGTAVFGGVAYALGAAAVAAQLITGDECQARIAKSGKVGLQRAVLLISDGLRIDEVAARIIVYFVLSRPFLLEKMFADQLTAGSSRKADYFRAAFGDPGEGR